jgi:hypothetical protein
MNKSLWVSQMLQLILGRSLISVFKGRGFMKKGVSLMNSGSISFYVLNEMQFWILVLGLY